MSIQMRSCALERPGALAAAHSAQLRKSVAAAGAATFSAPKSTRTSREAFQVRFLAVLHCRFVSRVAWVSMPLGAADAAAAGGSRGTAAKNGGEKMTMRMEAPAEAVAAVYSIAMELYAS